MKRTCRMLAYSFGKKYKYFSSLAKLVNIWRLNGRAIFRCWAKVDPLSAVLANEV